MEMENKRILLKLLSVNGLGSRRIVNLHTHFPNLEDVFGSTVRELCKIPLIDTVIAQRILHELDETFADRQMKILSQNPYKMTTIFDSDYPVRLLNIYDPPTVLFHFGDFSERDADSIAIVGTRQPSVYGRQVTALLAKELVSQNITVVSGFARGVDTEAHKTVIASGGRTIAVLGNGIDVIYPSENRNLRNQLVDNGVYCSEFPLETKPDAVNFPRRNRIISGLCLGTIVIEAGEKSGALLTAYYSLDQNREVFAVPGRITDEKSIGTNRLIQRGAKLVTNIDDVLSEIESIRKFSTAPKQMEMHFFLEGEEKRVYESLTSEPMHIDAISEKIGKLSYEALTTLLALEIKGAVRQVAGKNFVRVG
ncbi:MAG: DNA-protecting protein DprA [Candidatus Marinimicrobia bacterium CG08_land_8_20_14_0_20_45_22]|nr:MAG: DNA-protecting protein DprA [Candidatus Marinimicrobia bacterium CG08_land_8_20_14_0_20_45_22]